jgi:hypothetical protein
MKPVVNPAPAEMEEAEKAATMLPTVPPASETDAAEKGDMVGPPDDAPAEAEEAERAATSMSMNVTEASDERRPARPAVAPRALP